ncbi:MAG: SRPBCC domain-containing protein [Planctomycetota bacterium]
MQNVILVFTAALLACTTAIAQEDRVVDEFEIEASVDDVWNAFTTTDGLKSWVAPLADIDFRVGGKWRANYNNSGKLGDETTIENTILCYDPKRMLSIKATGFPKGFEFVEAAKETWSIFYFTKISDTKTKITIVGLGYTDSEQSKKMRAFFKPANKYSMGQLKAALETKMPKDKDN